MTTNEILPLPAQLETYSKLKQSVRSVFVRGQTQIELLKVRTYWQTGCLIRDYLRFHPEERRRGSGVIERLAEDFGVERSLFYRLLCFAEAFPNVATSRHLTWSHYRELLGVSDPAKRKELAQAAEHETWPVRKLRFKAQQANISAAGPLAPERTLLEEPARRSPGVFKIKIMKEAGAPDRRVLDLGFEHYAELPESLKELPEGSLVSGESLPEMRARGSESVDDLYYYEARTERVVDGDTILVHVPLAGLGIRRLYLRLRGVNAAEVGTEEGERAREWLTQKVLANSTLLIRTHKTDRYDRYIADVWAVGEYLNNGLLAAGLASAYTGQP